MATTQQEWVHPQWCSSVNLGWGGATSIKAAKHTQISREVAPCTSFATIRPDPFAPRMAGPEIQSYAPRMPKYQVTDPLEKAARRNIKSPHMRLYRTPTHNTSARRIASSGLIRTPERNSRPLSSHSFFRASEPKPRSRPLVCAHEFRVVQSPSSEVQRAYRSWSPEKARPRSPLRIVRHEYKGYALSKRNPNVSPAGVSRKIDGTYFSN